MEMMIDFSAEAEIQERASFFREDNNYGEYFMEWIFYHFVKPGDTVLDVGANKGLHTIPLAQLVGKSGKVYAFEPIPDLAQSLRERTQGYGVEVVEAAATTPEKVSANADTPFFHITKQTGHSGLQFKGKQLQQFDPETIMVKTTTLDATVSPADSVSFIKIDAEGGDFHVIRGGQNILERDKPLVIFEATRSKAANLYSYTENDFFDFFKKVNYKLFTFTGESFTKEKWLNDNIYHELWAVHENSPFIYFFEHNLMQFASRFTKFNLMYKKERLKNFDRLTSNLQQANATKEHYKKELHDAILEKDQISNKLQESKKGLDRISKELSVFKKKEKLLAWKFCSFVHAKIKAVTQLFTWRA